MASVMLVSGAGIVAHSILAKTISAAVEVAASLSSAGLTHPDVQRELERLDIDVTLRTIEAMVKDLESRGLNGSQQNALRLCVESLEDSVNKIHKSLVAIHEEEQYHKSKWFASWRTANFGPLMEQLRAHKEIMDKRLQTFAMVISLANNK